MDPLTLAWTERVVLLRRATRDQLAGIDWAAPRAPAYAAALGAVHLLAVPDDAAWLHEAMRGAKAAHRLRADALRAARAADVRAQSMTVNRIAGRL